MPQRRTAPYLAVLIVIAILCTNGSLAAAGQAGSGPVLSRNAQDEPGTAPDPESLEVAVTAAPSAAARANFEFGNIWGGKAQAIALRGNRAYLGLGARLIVLDITNPSAPAVVGQSRPLAGVLTDVAVAGNYAYVTAGEAGLRVLSLVPEYQPAEVGYADTPGVAQSVALVGGYAYVAETGVTRGGLRIVDVKDPARPALAGSLFGPEPVYQVAVAGSYAYVATEIYLQGLQVLQVSDPGHPQIVTHAAISGARAVAVANNYAYTVTGDGIYAVNISNPAAPAPGPAYTPAWLNAIQRVAAGSGRAYFALGNPNYPSWQGMRVVDVSNPANMVERGHVDTVDLANNVALSGTTVYLTAEDTGLHVINAANADAPVEQGGYGEIGRANDSAILANEYLYVVTPLRHNGLAVFDVSTGYSNHPHWLGFADLPNGGSRIVINGLYAYIASDSLNEIVIMFLGNPHNPVVVNRMGRGEPALDMAIHDNYLYVAGASGLWIYDLAAPDAPQRVGVLGITGGARRLVIDGGFAYVTDGVYGLRIYDVHHTYAHPASGGYVRIRGNTNGVATDDMRVYVAADEGEGQTTLHVIDAANWRFPSEMASIPVPGEAADVALVGRTAYVGSQGVQAVNVADVGHLYNSGSYLLPQNTYAQVTSLSNNVYLSAGDAGLVTVTYGYNLGFEGRTVGLAGRQYQFTVHPNWYATSTPIDYLWQVTDQGATTHLGGGSTDTATFAWNTPGTKTIDVTATSSDGVMHGTRMVTIAAPPAALRLGMDIPPHKPSAVGHSLDLVEATGFDYAKMDVKWWMVEPQSPFSGPPSMDFLDHFVDEANSRGVRPVLRIYDPPMWAVPADSNAHTPANAADLGGFVGLLVSQYGTRVAGYVIWNEPNLSTAWGNRQVDAAAYMSMLHAAYTSAKAVNPAVTIVSAGLAPAQDGTGVAGDLGYLQALYAAGLRDNCDIVGMNGLGFALPPDDTSDPNGYNFNRLAQLRQIMVNNGDAGKPAWALEVGWLADTTKDLGAFNSWKVPESRQAIYLRRAIDKAASEWPWLAALFIWNLDFGNDYVHSQEIEKPYFAIADRLAYHCVSYGPDRQCLLPRLYLPIGQRP
jgi:hypothetical protein